MTDFIAVTAAAAAAIVVTGLSAGQSVQAAGSRNLVWVEENGKSYWYENNERQGTSHDPQGVYWKNDSSTNRGREIYDPASNGWYWLDALYDGAKATDKEVFMPYTYQGEDAWDDAAMRQNANASDAGMQDFVYQSIKDHTGKWVRYDENGKMLTGWVEIKGNLAKLYPKQAGNTYYYDHKTGLMAKGTITLGGVKYHFDEVSGALTGDEKPSGKYLDVTDYGATPDDDTDDLQAFKNAIASLKSSGTDTVYVPRGRYMISAEHIDTATGNWNGIYLNVDGMKFIMSPYAVLQAIGTREGQSHVLSVRFANHIEISGGTIRGERYTHKDPGSDSEGHGVACLNVSDVNIHDVTVEDCWGDGIYLGTPNGQEGCDQITIRNCKVNNNRRNNLAIVKASNVTVDSCEFNGAGEANGIGVDIETNEESDWCENITIRNSTFSGNGLGSLYLIRHGSNVLIDGCRLDDLAIRLSRNVTVTNTTVKGRSVSYSNYTDDGSHPVYEE